MATLVSIAAEVEASISGGDPARRIEALRKITTLFLDQAPQLGQGHVALFDEVIARLSRAIEFRARVELAERLADLPNGPPQTVRELAFDDAIAVAGPVIERSPVISEDDLVAIAAGKSQDHLFALSRRSGLTERVTDVLVDRGDDRVVRAVAENDRARFSDQGFASLVEKARADEDLQRLLQSRADLPPDYSAVLVVIAGAQARRALHRAPTAQPAAAIEAVVEQVSGGLASADIARSLSRSDAPIRASLRPDQFSEEGVTALVREGRIEDALVAMASLAKVPFETVTNAYHAASYDPLLFLVRSLRFGWGTFKLLLTAKAGRTLPDKVLRSAFDSYQKLSVQTAQRVVQFTAVRDRAGRDRTAGTKA
ncbi:MAG TPA: DUF2336 domain-containing protein [Beijerinckiaceae bacterium]|jgi:uncharacterized protein (DUF2336 family)